MLLLVKLAHSPLFRGAGMIKPGLKGPGSFITISIGLCPQDTRSDVSKTTCL